MVQPRHLCTFFVALLVAVCIPLSAWACGGMFCSFVPGNPNPGVNAPAPVDQTAERIVFEVDPGTITAHVQIQYTGSADQFAWIVPVPSVPLSVEESTIGIQGIDARTSPLVILPDVPICEGASAPVFADEGGDGCSCGELESDSGSAGNNGNLPDDVDPDNPVTVYNQGFTRNYEFVVVSAEDASELTSWLSENGYNVSDNMVPVMQPYIDESMVFLALKLQDGLSASDIVPIAFTYEDDQPMIPIQLTAVAAQPMMGILVFILADGFYVPANYDSIVPATEEILHDPAGVTNYYDWMARRAGQAEGKLWVQEYVGVAPNMQSVRHPSVSRYYARMSPEHMTVDPVFVASDAQGELDGFIDLSDRPSMVCNDYSPTLQTIDERVPSACAWQFCGMSGECVVNDGSAGCICNNNMVAQTFSGPDGQARLTCVPADNPYGITAQASGVGTEFDPCNGVDCGLGECVVKSGFPTCRCADGAAAFVNGGLPRCRVIPSDPETFGPGAGLESEGSTEPLSAQTTLDAQESDDTGLGVLLPFALGLGFLAALRRRTGPRHRPE